MTATRFPWSRWIVLFLSMAVVLAACSDEGEEALGGDGLPVKNPAESYGNTSAPISGEITLESSGCWTIEIGGGAALVVFPEGWLEDGTGAAMTSPDGALSVASGDTVDGVGGSVPAETFPGVPDGYWGNYLAFCEPAVHKFVVLDEILSVDT